jgi:uncharacterized RDD family membrane protein YckC
MQYASFWRRFGAFWIDFVVLLPLTGISYFFGEKSRLFYVYWFVPGLLIGLWFHVYLVKRYGGTPGKLLLKTRIAMVDGSPVTAKAAAIRYSVLFGLSVVSSIALLMSTLSMTDDLYFSLGYLDRSQKIVAMAPPWYSLVSILMQVWIWGEFVTMLLNKKRRAVHDFIAETIVIKSVPPSA